MANTSKRGFASMDAAKQREIASKGGRAAHAKGTAHEFTSEEARVAGRKGGEAVSRDRNHMSTIGREGGHSRGARARAAAGTNAGNASGSNANDASRTESFERQVTSERSAFEPSGRGIERASDRGGFSSSQGTSNNSRSNERSGDDSGRDRGSFGGRGQL
jgi:general stress protein YciG